MPGGAPTGGQATGLGDVAAGIHAAPATGGVLALVEEEPGAGAFSAARAFLNWLALETLCAVQFMDVLGVTVVVTALPSMLTDLHAPQFYSSLIATAYAMSFGACSCWVPDWVIATATVERSS